MPQAEAGWQRFDPGLPCNLVAAASQLFEQLLLVRAQPVVAYALGFVIVPFDGRDEILDLFFAQVEFHCRPP